MRSKKKVIAGALLAVVIILSGLYIFTDSIISGEWKDKEQAVLRAYKETPLVEALRAESFVGEEPYIIVFGLDKLGKPMIAWVSESAVQSKYETEGVSREAVEELVRAGNPEAQIIRITPGVFEEELVWEVYSSREQADGKSGHYYDYYRFADGELLDTYRLG